MADDRRVSGVPASRSDLGIYLYWIPLGAGGSGFVRLNGRIYEGIKALMERRSPVDLYHTALEARTDDGRFIVETMWPSPGGDVSSRGVVAEAPVFARWMSGTRLFRYEVRCWPDGVLPDADMAVGGARRVSADAGMARELIRVVGSVPTLIWGRDQLGAGEMWNSNSVVSWALTRCGLPMADIQPPDGGRAPGWGAGIGAARRHPLADGVDVPCRPAFNPTPRL